MAGQIPLKLVVDANSQVQGLGEFIGIDYVSVANGGTGSISFADNQVLIGNGADTIQTISRRDILPATDKVIITNGSNTVMGDSNLIIDVDETKIDIENTTGIISRNRVEAPVTVGFVEGDLNLDPGEIV